MKNSRKILTVALLLCSIFFVNIPLTVKAAEIIEYAEYDISEGGTQNFEIQDSDGELIHITISADISVQSRGVSNGTYQITYTSPGAWKAGYKISVSGDKISSVHSPYFSTITGSITSSRLSKDSTKQATYNLTYKVQSIYISTGIKSVISGSSIKVSGL